MSRMLGRIARARAIALFAAARASDYAELLKLEIVQYRKALVRSLVGCIALAFCGLVTASFVSVAVIVTYWETAMRVQVAWLVAGAWFLLSLVALWLARAVLKEQPPFAALGEQLQLDLQAIRDEEQR
ncbi:phage holin family protein [Orrella sp. JC864]|uniref:phage holin family protein n=1 Tax=Orrella sp. JC864 TaxID=3120298 RepID=UPI0012BC7714